MIALPRAWFDWLAVSLSGACAVHCVASLLLIALFSASGLLGGHDLHAALLLVAAPLTVYALGVRAYQEARWRPFSLGVIGLALLATALLFEHGALAEVALSIAGSMTIIIAHLANLRSRMRFCRPA